MLLYSKTAPKLFDFPSVQYIKCLANKAEMHKNNCALNIPLNKCSMKKIPAS